MTRSGAVLAGGRSSRFGSDKARVVLFGKPLLAHVLASLADCEERFIVSDRPYPEFGVPCYPDARASSGEGVAGPLPGLVAALERARHPWLALAACDLPCLSPEYWRALAGAALPGVRAVAVLRDGRAEPLAALYHRELLGELRERLERRELSLQSALRGPDIRLLPTESLGVSARALLNVNAPDDLLSCDPCHARDPS